MAETNEPIPAPGPPASAAAPKSGTELWVVAALAAAALLCLSALAVSLVLILGRSGAGSPGASIQVNPVINAGAPAAGTPPPPPAAALQRPAEPSRPQAVRGSAQDLAAAALPGLLATPTAVVVRREKQLVRADTDAPPATAFQPPPAPKIYLRVRSVGPSQYDGRNALPMPVRYSPDAYGKVPNVFAVPAASAPAAAPTAPEVAYSDSGISQGGWDLQLSSARKTAALDGYRAPEGFQFFTAKLGAINRSPSPAVLDQDKLEVRDADGVRYLSNPELNAGLSDAPVAPGAGGSVTLSFLVPEAAELRSLALLTGQAPLLVPLAKK